MLSHFPRALPAVLFLLCCASPIGAEVLRWNNSEECRVIAKRQSDQWHAEYNRQMSCWADNRCRNPGADPRFTQWQAQIDQLRQQCSASAEAERAQARRQRELAEAQQRQAEMERSRREAENAQRQAAQRQQLEQQERLRAQLAQEQQAREIQARNQQAREAQAREAQAREMAAREQLARQMQLQQQQAQLEFQRRQQDTIRQQELERARQIAVQQQARDEADRQRLIASRTEQANRGATQQAPVPAVSPNSTALSVAPLPPTPPRTVSPTAVQVQTALERASKTYEETMRRNISVGGTQMNVGAIKDTVVGLVTQVLEDLKPTTFFRTLGAGAARTTANPVLELAGPFLDPDNAKNIFDSVEAARREARDGSRNATADRQLRELMEEMERTERGR